MAEGTEVQTDEETETIEGTGIETEIEKIIIEEGEIRVICTTIIQLHRHKQRLIEFFNQVPMATTFLKFPNGKTSPILEAPPNSITSLSMPQPQPPVGGSPSSRTRT